MLYYKLLGRYAVNLNIAAFVFVIFYLLSFSYPRASLGMALYFYGVCCLTTGGIKIKTVLWTLLCFFLSFCAHRSMIVLIAMTPVAFIRINKKIILIILLFIPVMNLVVQNTITDIMAQGFAGEGLLSSFATSTESYANMVWEVDYNWKFLLIKALRNSSFYVSNIWLLWIYVFKRRYMPDSLKKLLAITTVVTAFSSLFLVSLGTNLGLEIIGYRFLYMTGIPLTILMAYTYQQRYCKKRTLLLVLLPAFLYAEGFILGKIISLA